MYRPLTIGTIFGKNLRLHWSWPLLPAGVAAYSFAIHPWSEAAFDVLLLLAVYLCILLHEGTQFLAAKRLGLGTRDLTLYPFWGVVRLTRLSERPWQERHIAAIGPIVLALLAAVVAAILGLVDVGLALPQRVAQPTTAMFVVRVFWALVALTAFHTLPLLPLDGGRILRTTLALRSSRLRATEIAAVSSTVGAGVLLFVAIFWLKSPFLGTIAALIFIAAQEDLGATRYMDRLRQPMANSTVTPALLAPMEQLVTSDCRPNEQDFTGFTWNANARLWIEWQDGQPVAANALIGDGGP